MPFNPDEYISLAENLVGLHGKVEPRGLGFSTQAVLRAAVSRAYYGALLRAREYAGVSVRKNDSESHNAVIKYYENRTEPEAKTVAGLLLGLKSLRKKADYKIEGSISLRQANDALADAKEILDTLTPDD